MELIRLLLAGSRARVLAATALGLATSAVAVALIALLNRAAHHEVSWGLGASFLLACSLLLACRVFSQRLVIRVMREEIYRLTVDLSRQILRAPLRHVERTTPARLYASLTDDVLVIANALEVLALLLAAVASILAALVYVAILSPVSLAAVGSLLVVGAGAYRIVARRAYQAFGQARTEQDALFANLRAMAEGAKELRLGVDRERDFYVAALEPSARRVRDEMISGLNAAIGGMAFGEAWFFLVVGAIAFVLPGLSSVSSEAVGGIALACVYLMGPVTSVFKLMPNLTRASVALRKIRALGFAVDERRTGAEWPLASLPVLRFERRLAAKALSFRYEGERGSNGFELGPLDLFVEPGEIVFIAGGNGTGKSTLAKVITGLYAPTSGELWVDDVCVVAPWLPAYRRLFSAVFSDGFVFERLFGDAHGVDDAELRAALCLLELDGKVEVERGVLSTTALSQGQRKRLALLVAYLEDRPIYIFDEWAADQDPRFKRAFYRELLPRLKRRGRAVVCITHDDHYFDAADRILVLEDGRIAHEEKRLDA